MTALLLTNAGGLLSSVGVRSRKPAAALPARSLMSAPSARFTRTSCALVAALARVSTTELASLPRATVSTATFTPSTLTVKLVLPGSALLMASL